MPFRKKLNVTRPGLNDLPRDENRFATSVFEEGVAAGSGCLRRFSKHEGGGSEWALATALRVVGPADGDFFGRLSEGALVTERHRLGRGREYFVVIRVVICVRVGGETVP